MLNSAQALFSSVPKHYSTAVQKCRDRAGSGESSAHRRQTDARVCARACVPVLNDACACVRACVLVAVCFQHLGDDTEALRVCEDGLLDPSVRGGDRLTLVKRHARLSGKRRPTRLGLADVDAHADHTCPAPLCSAPGSREGLVTLDPDGARLCAGVIGKVSAPLQQRLPLGWVEGVASPDALADLDSDGPHRYGEMIVEALDLDGNNLDMQALGARCASLPVDLLPGARLGDRLTGKKSRFAGYDPLPASAGPGPAAAAGWAVEVVGSEDGGICCVEQVCCHLFPPLFG